MKKLVVALIAITAFAFVSCDEPEQTNNPGECTVTYEGVTYVGSCEEIQRIIEENESLAPEVL
jgi:hypothetical protein